MNTKQERRKMVDQANANAALDGYAPSERDSALQEAFVEGKITVEDLLKDAQEFAKHAGSKGT